MAGEQPVIRRDDPFDLQRFVEAQAPTYDRALSEIGQGRKTSHWMWFVFPQIAGLGQSEMSKHYAIRSLEEARAYLEHPVLGTRYRECVAALQDMTGTSADAVFGRIDAAKLKSSLTLFSRAAPDERLFAAALERWFGGHEDPQTVELLIPFPSDDQQ